MMFYGKLVSILAALFILVSALVSAQSSRDKWNVVLITVDTLRADHSGSLWIQESPDAQHWSSGKSRGGF